MRLQQAVQVHDHIAHFGIVDSALRGGAPGFFGGFVIGKHANHVDRFQVDEFCALRVFDAAAHHEVKFLHGVLFCKGIRNAPLTNTPLQFKDDERLYWGRPLW